MGSACNICNEVPQQTEFIVEFPTKSRYQNLRLTLKVGKPSQNVTIANKFQIEAAKNVGKISKQPENSDLHNLQEKMSVQQLLQYAEEKYKEKFYQSSEKIYKLALKRLQDRKQKSIDNYQKIALCNLNLININLLTDQNKDIQNYAKSALEIYDSNEGIYYEQKIILLNSISLHLQKNNKLKEAIQVQKQILKLQEIYFPKNDERTWLTTNNIACYYYQNGQEKQGNQLFTQLLSKIQDKKQIKSAIKANHQFYLNNNINKH